MPHLHTFRLLALICLMLLPARQASSQSQPPRDTVAVTLGTAIRLALDISPEVGAVAAERDFAEARSRLARASRYATEFTATSAHAAVPGLDIPNPDTPTDALYLDPDVRNDWDKIQPYNRVEVQLIQPLYTWGELGGSIRAARHGVAVEDAAVQQKESEVALRTGELYYGLLLTDALMRLTERAGEIVERAQVEIQRLIDEGATDVDDADLFQVQITEQEYRRRVVEVTQRQQTARSALARQLFLPPGSVVTAGDALLAPVPFQLETLNTYFAVALANRAELRRASAGVAAREALVDVAKSHFYPKLFLGADAAWSYAPGRYRQPSPYVGDPFIGRSVRAGLGFRQQLNFAQTRARVEQARAEENEVRFQLQAAEQLVLFEVEDAYRNVIIAAAALEAQERALDISNQWLRTEQINFDLDLGDTENLVKAVRANLELEAEYNSSVQRYNVAVLRLLSAAGVLVPESQSGTLVE